MSVSFTEVFGGMAPMVRASSRASRTGVAIDVGDDVAGQDAGLDRRAVGLRLGDQRAAHRLQTEALGDLGA